MARKSKWDYKPESWKHMSKRNDYGCLIIIMIFCCLTGIASCCASCTKEEDANSPIPNKVDEPKNTIDKISGVWESVNDDLFFISINTQGRVSYCFSQNTMGIGHGTLIEKKLTIENDYSGFSDELYVENNNGLLYLRGLIKKKGTNENESISFSLKKVDEPNVYSFIGEFWKPFSGIHVEYGSVQETLSFIGDNVAQYRHYVVKTGKVLSESVWYYIPRSHHKRGDIIYANHSIQKDCLIQAHGWHRIINDLF